MASKPLTLRCKYKNGQSVLNSLSYEMTVEEFKALLYSLTDIQPSCMKVLIGFPPSPLDLSNDNQTLGQLELSSGETLIVEERPPLEIPPRAPQPDLIPLFYPRGILMRKVVPANNSCLFTSVHFNLSGGEFSNEAGKELRKVISEAVSADKETYNEAFLGKSNADYCSWIMNEDHWGGGIEISILAKHYKMEIVAVDTQNVCMHRFGEDADYDLRMLLIYDGIHYDPLMLEPLDGGGGPITTIFPSADEGILQMALEIAHEAKASRQFTDVQAFTLKCLVCGQSLVGQSEAQVHAKKTGHINFGEF